MIRISLAGQHSLGAIEAEMAEAFAKKLVAEFGEQLHTVILFGSRARGDAEAESDMDVLVTLSEIDAETRRRVRFLATDVWLEYGIFLSTRVLSLAQWRELEKRGTALYRSIRDEGIILFRQMEKAQGQ
jgi:hypothetical protein